jgi:hypothetical protein
LSILEMLKWPAVVVLLGIGALAFFRANIARLIDRIKGFGPKGFESPIDAPQAPQTASTPESSALAVTSTAAAEADVLHTFTNPLELRVDQQLRQTIAAFNDADKQKYLLKACVRALIQLHFERTFRAIYRSQIHALEFLATLDQTSRGTIRLWYDKATEENTTLYASYTFEQWLGFMERAYFIAVTPESVSLTVDGREFLKFLIDRGYPTFSKAN